MLNPEQVLQWPYGEFETMDPNKPALDVSALPKTLVRGYRGPSSERKPWDATEVRHYSGAALRGAYISNTDRNKGAAAEASFAAACVAAGLKVFTLPHFSHNYLKHIDFEVECPDGLCVWVDVKAPKALRKLKCGPDDPFARQQDHYVGFHLQPSGDLFGSQADLVAFGRTDGSFVLADRLCIVDIVEDKLEGASARGRSAWPETALWAPYVRSWGSFHTVMAYMELEDLAPALRARIGQAKP